jgi:hypothetical protein
MTPGVNVLISLAASAKPLNSRVGESIKTGEKNSNELITKQPKPAVAQANVQKKASLLLSLICH